MANSALKLQLLTDQSLPFWNTANTFSVNMSAPTGLAGNVNFILPGTQPTATGQILYTTAAGISNWTTATYPLTTTANQLLYSTGANTISGLATGNNSVLITSAGGVPSMSTTLPAAVLGNITSVGALSAGSLAAGFTPVTVPIGGTGNTTFTAYSIICAGTTATGTFQNVVGLGTNGYVLTSTGPGSLPTWQSTGAVTGVASVTGTALQIDATPTTGNVVVSIDAGYLGQTSITTLGTIGTGTWAATNIALNHGGTNAALVANNGGIFYSTATAGAILAGTATAQQLLMSGASTTPQWSTSTYPTTNAINTLLYASGANVMGALATVNSASLVTSSAGVPTWLGPLTNGQIIIGSTGAIPVAATLTAGANITITNTAGTITIAGDAGTVTAVTGVSPIASTGGATPAISLNGTATVGQVLQSASATTTAYSTATYPLTTTINQLLYSSAANTIVGLATATTAVLTTAAGVPTWAAELSLALGGTNAALTASNGGIFYSTATAGAILAGTATAGQLLTSGASTTPAWTTSTYPATNAVSTLLYASSANVMAALATANSGTLATSATGVPSIVALGATQTLVGVSGGTPAAGTIPGKNMVINGDFQVWQRGAGGSASFAVGSSTTQYVADRWQCQVGAVTTAVISQAAGATSGSYLCEIQRTNGNAGTGNIAIETSLTRDMCIGAANNIITISFKAKAGVDFSSAGNNINIVVFSGTGSTDVSNLSTGFAGQTSVISQSVNLTTTLTNFSYSSSAIGSGVTQLAIIFYYTPVGSAGANDWFAVTDVQLEISPVQTPFERLPFTVQLQRCQYFYQKSFDYTIAPAQASASYLGAACYRVQISSTVAGWSFDYFYKTTMRISPTITYYNPINSNTSWYNISATADSGAAITAVTPGVGVNRVIINNPQVVGDSVQNTCLVHLSLDADLT